MLPAQTSRNEGTNPRSGIVPQARITVERRSDGWLTVTIERARRRRFNLALDELPDLLAKLAPHCQPVTVTRMPAASCAVCGSPLDGAGDCPSGCGARMPARVTVTGGRS